MPNQTEFIDRTELLEEPNLLIMLPLKCIVCNWETTVSHKCSCSQVNMYCSTKCQEEDYPVHSIVCKGYEAVANIEPKPPASHKLVILLLEDHSKPQFWFAPIEVGKDGQETVNFSALGEGFYMGKKYEIDQRLFEVMGNERNPRFKIDHHVTMYACKPQHQNNPLNNPIDLLMNRRAPRIWSGPFVIVSQTKDWHPRFQSVTLTDLRLAVDFLRTFDTQRGCESYDRDFIARQLYVRESFDAVLSKGTYENTLVEAVVIACQGDRNLLGRPHYMPVRVKADHPAFEVNITKISAAMNLGVVTYILPSSDIWRTKSSHELGYNPYENREVTFMNIDVNAPDLSWGHANVREWGLRVGSVLVVRKNRAGISVQQAEAFAEYCDKIIQREVAKECDLEKAARVAQRPLSKWRTRMNRLKVLHRCVCRDTFEDYFEYYKAKKLREGRKDWEGAISPYKELPLLDEAGFPIT